MLMGLWVHIIRRGVDSSERDVSLSLMRTHPLLIDVYAASQWVVGDGFVFI